MSQEIKYVCKDQSWVMRFIGYFDPAFMKDMWTTVCHTIYYPVGTGDPMADRWKQVRSHEMMHVAQFEKYTVVLMALAYIFFPLPFLFSGRWLIERHPYLEDIRAKAESVDQAVSTLWSYYFWPWPKSLMKSWFENSLKK